MPNSNFKPGTDTWMLEKTCFNLIEEMVRQTINNHFDDTEVKDPSKQPLEYRRIIYTTYSSTLLSVSYLHTGTRTSLSTATNLSLNLKSD
ncbi:hypothetical protein Csa_017223 [Cucumis sativus]|uniref:Homoserine kinase n=1 Tax=Cucumis sativus TaxID=3659 RepID=A0A0A0K6J4_CUCSA|nr:hypothetical protein Csa_017223 [Cucumis sativus]